MDAFAPTMIDPRRDSLIAINVREHFRREVSSGWADEERMAGDGGVWLVREGGSRNARLARVLSRPRGCKAQPGSGKQL